MSFNPVVRLQKGVVTLTEAADWLGISEYDLRLRVRQKVIKPVNYDPSDGLMHLRATMYFRRDEIEKQWRDFISVERDVRDEMKYLIATVNQLARDVTQILERVKLPEYINLRALAAYLGVHPVTLRKKVFTRDGHTGHIDLSGYGPLDCYKIEGAWKVYLPDVKKLLRAG